MKIKKKNRGGEDPVGSGPWGGGGGGGVRVDLNKRIDVFMKIQKKNRGGWVGGVRLGGGGGQGGCERRSKVFVKI